MKITVDTNILLRAILEDDPGQAAEARAIMEQATSIAIPVPVFCELVWTMRRLYRRQPDEIADAVEAILRVAAVETGLRILRTGGDFADGAIAWQGAAMGGDTFMTFDRQAVHLLTAAGLSAQTPPPRAERTGLPGERAIC